MSDVRVGSNYCVYYVFICISISLMATHMHTSNYTFILRLQGYTITYCMSTRSIHFKTKLHMCDQVCVKVPFFTHKI